MSSGLGQVAQIARLRPSGTTAVELFQANAPLEVTSIFMCNTSGAPATFRLFHAFNDSTTYNETTALYWDKLLPADDTLVFRPESIGAGIKLAELDRLAVRVSVANALTFTVYGVPATIAQIQMSGV